MLEKGGKMDKDTFIEALTCMTKEQIAKFIREKGKEPRMVRPFIILPDDKTGKGGSTK